MNKRIPLGITFTQGHKNSTIKKEKLLIVQYCPTIVVIF